MGSQTKSGVGLWRSPGSSQDFALTEAKIPVQGMENVRIQPVPLKHWVFLSDRDVCFHWFSLSDQPMWSSSNPVQLEEMSLTFSLPKVSSQSAGQRNNLTLLLEQALESLLGSTLFLARGASLVSLPEKPFAALLLHVLPRKCRVVESWMNLLEWGWKLSRSFPYVSIILLDYNQGYFFLFFLKMKKSLGIAPAILFSTAVICSSVLSH